MKLGIIADTHDNLDAIALAVEYFNKSGVEQVIHAGDYVAPFALEAFRKLKASFRGVWGNNDGERIILHCKAREWGFKLHNSPHHFDLLSKKILLMHEPYELEALIKSQCYDLIVYGHLHRPEIRRVGSTLVISPGEGSGCLTKRRTVAVLNLDNWEGQIVEI
jgi:putative phosphoesterase